MSRMCMSHVNLVAGEAALSWVRYFYTETFTYNETSGTDIYIETEGHLVAALSWVRCIYIENKRDLYREQKRPIQRTKKAHIEQTCCRMQYFYNESNIFTSRVPAGLF